MAYISLIISLITLSISVIIYYEIVSYTWHFVNRKYRIKPRMHVVYVVFATFISHMLVILLYSLAYYIMSSISNNSVLFDTVYQNGSGHAILDLIYFSATTYSSLGYGDIIPLAELRIITMFEVINGLVLIAWSASSTYLAMQRSWRFRA